MFRRGVSFLVLVGFLASQLAVMPHAHGSATPEEQQKHDAAPHFHCAWLGHSDHDHHHGHSSAGHGHSHHATQHEGGLKSSTDSSDGQSLTSGLRGADHDADAIFVSEQAATASRSTDQLVSAWQLVGSAPLPTCLGDVQSGLGPSPRWHPPDEVLDASDTYLTLRNLRI